MPVFRDVGLNLDLDTIVARWGRGKQRLSHGRALDEACQLLVAIAANRWLRPAVSFVIHRVVDHTKVGIELSNTAIASPLLAHRLCRADQLVAAVGTLGPAISTEITGLFAAKQPLRAVILDQIATIALYALSDSLERYLRAHGTDLGLEVSGMLSPGDRGFDLSEQATLLDLAKAHAIGVSITSAGMLQPAKSISMVAGLGTRMPSWNRGDNCASCNARDRCPYREQTPREVWA
jgi:hypothetical protein